MVRDDALRQSLLSAVQAEDGHFLYESGHHGDLWLDLNRLFVDVAQVRLWAAARAEATSSAVPQLSAGRWLEER